LGVAVKKIAEKAKEESCRSGLQPD